VANDVFPALEEGGDRYSYRKLVVTEAGRLLTDVAGSLNLQPSGLNTAMITTTMNVTDVAGKLPVIPLTDRNSIIIHNTDTVNTIYIGTSSEVVAGRTIGTTSGYELAPQSYFNIDVTEDIEIYGVAESGKTILVKVLEIA